MSHPLAPSARVLRALAVVLATALLITLAAVTAPLARAAAPTGGSELVKNSDFSSGIDGWKTNKPNDHVLSVGTGRSGSAAKLYVKSASTVILNDVVNTVSSTPKGATYRMKAWVRSDVAGVAAQIKAREGGKSNFTHETRVKLTGTGWQELSFTFAAREVGSKLDLNVLFMSPKVGKSVYVDSVSLVPTGGSGAALPQPTATATPKPTATATPKPTATATPAPGKCQAAPPTGTLFGTHLSTSDSSFPVALKELDATFGKLPVVRQFNSGLPMSWSSSNAKLLSGRTIVMSFKANPKDITSGRHDAFFRDWFKSAPADQTIYWSYYHEPENNINKGEFTAAQYRAAWAHLATIANGACKPNMHATLILTGWTMESGSKRNYRDYDAGPEYVKVLAFDPYNGASDPDRDYYKSAEAMLGPIVTKMKADGRPWAIAETGSRIIPSDKDGSGRAAWLSSVASYAEKNGARFVTYFHSRGFDLNDSRSIGVWRELVNR